MHRADYVAVGLVALVAVGLRLAFFPHAAVFFEGDARGYVVRAVEIASGEGLNFTLKRTPGYSLFIAGLFRLAGPSLEAVVVAQHLLGVATALAAYGLARVLAGWPAGLLAGLATAASGSALVYEHVILSETLFTLLLTVGIWMMVVALRRRNPGWPAVAGVLAGIAALVRPIGLVLLPILPVLSVLVLRRRALVASGWYLAAFTVALAPWVARNVLVHGEAAPVHPGRFLIERTVKHNPTGVAMYAGPDSPDDPKLLRDGRRILREIAPEDPTSFEIHDALSRRLKLTDTEASDLMWELSVDAIWRHPGAYALGTWTELIRVVLGQAESVEEHVLARRSAWKGRDLERLLRDGKLPQLLPEALPDHQQQPRVAEQIARLYQPSAWIAAILAANALALYWALRDPCHRAVLLPLGVTAALVVCTAVINGGYPRYRYPLDPLLHVSAAAGLAWTVGAVRDARAAGSYGRPISRWTLVRPRESRTLQG